MARISSYPQDASIENNDAWVGTDSLTRSTKQYTASAVAKYLNIKGKISIAAQMAFRYEITGTGAGDFSGPADGLAMTSITTLQLSIKDKSGQGVVGFITYLVGSNIIIGEQNNISTFGHYKITGYTESTSGFYTLNLLNIGGSGNLTNKLFYDFAVFNLSSKNPTNSQTFEFTQGVPSAVWNINHNLGKFPSISVVDTGETVVAGEYTYIDNNNVTLNFSVAFPGKAYLN